LPYVVEKVCPQSKDPVFPIQVERVRRLLVDASQNPVSLVSTMTFEQYRLVDFIALVLLLLKVKIQKRLLHWIKERHQLEKGILCGFGGFAKGRNAA